MSYGAVPPKRTPKRFVSKLARKRELMEQARRAGWRGKSYRKAKQFERALTRAGVK